MSCGIFSNKTSKYLIFFSFDCFYVWINQSINTVLNLWAYKRLKICAYGGISSFKSKQLQLHWQWEMDLIAREQLVSSLKQHVRWLCALIPVPPQGYVLGYYKKKGKYLCQHCILIFFHHWKVYYALSIHCEAAWHTGVIHTCVTEGRITNPT